MQKENLLSKIFLFLATASGILWTGTYFAKFIVLYQLFEPGSELVLREGFNVAQFSPVFQIIFPVLSLNAIFLPVFFLSLILYVITSKQSLKDEGWLFIALILMVCTALAEGALLIIFDYPVLMKLNSGSFAPQEIFDGIKARLKLAGGFTFGVFLVQLTIVFLLTLKPFRKNQPDK
ncbi:MAG: hypothetical protein HUU43_14420 [Ignavibacteriaceae bacterium]|nr:hypothetical protein [Ignavibacteriaceae bacterium]